MSGLFVWPDPEFLIFRSEVPKPVARSKPSDVPRPFLGKHLLRPALLTLVPKNPGSRVALEGISSSGASSRLARIEPEGSPQSCRRRSVLLSLPSPSSRCRLSGERLGRPPRSLEDHAPSFRVAEAKFLVTSLWITGISGTTVGTFPAGGVRLPIRSPLPTSFRCLNRLCQ